MIPVEEKPEPADFDDRVRTPGTQYLATNPNPNSWANRSYWREALQDLWVAYSGICAYSCHWIPPDTGGSSVDHYLPKSIRPDLAYEWSNYRLAAAKFNARKWNHLDVLDPFEIEEETFVIVFPAMLIKPGPGLSPEEKEHALETIDRLKLNADETLVSSRLRWILDYCDDHISYHHLQEKAPFIAYELRRQGLVETVRIMFRTRRLM